jgi:hypothetical protein
VLSNISLAFQAQDATPYTTSRAIAQSLKKLKKLKDSEFDVAKKFRQAVQFEGSTPIYLNEEFPSVPEREMAQNNLLEIAPMTLLKDWSRKSFRASREDFRQQCPGSAATKLLTCTCCQYTKEEEDSFLVFGDEHVATLRDHFSELLTKKGCDVNALLGEWYDLKCFVNLRNVLI